MISRKKIILLLLLPLCSLWTMAQELTVKGTVKDDSGLELYRCFNSGERNH